MGVRRGGEGREGGEGRGGEEEEKRIRHSVARSAWNVAAMWYENMGTRTHIMYMMTPIDHISQVVSYVSGPRTSGAVCM